MAASLSTFTMIAAVPPTPTTGRNITPLASLARPAHSYLSKSPNLMMISGRKSTAVPFAVSTNKAEATGGGDFALAPPLVAFGKQADQAADSTGGGEIILLLPLLLLFGKQADVSIE
ncbi:unnamed protein product [Linum trigynum]|uniref:Uncharacterized protein n=1 Tax=Linum trigynum TaxID=586398 RepID=A0AAV2FII6_9ROSI